MKILGIRTAVAPTQNQIRTKLNDSGNPTIERTGKIDCFIKKTPESLVENEGWFPYYFSGDVDKHDVETWLKNNKLPLDLYDIEHKPVYRNARFDSNEQQWYFDGFSFEQLEPLNIGRVYSNNMKLLGVSKDRLNGFLNIGSESNDYYLSESSYGLWQDIACEIRTSIITILRSPSMVRADIEPMYIQGVIKIAKSANTNLMKNGKFTKNVFDKLPLLKNFLQDHSMLPHLIALEVGSDQLVAVSNGSTNLHELRNLAVDIARQGYVFSPERTLYTLNNGQYFLAIYYQGEAIFIDNNGNVYADKLELFNRVQESLKIGKIHSYYSLMDNVLWNRIRHNGNNPSAFNATESYTLKWVEAHSSQHVYEKYWLLQAHQAGGITDLAAFYRYPCTENTQDRLVGYLMGPAYFISHEKPLDCSQKKYASIEALGIQPKEVEDFQKTMQEMVEQKLQQYGNSVVLEISNSIPV